MACSSTPDEGVPGSSTTDDGGATDTAAIDETAASCAEPLSICAGACVDTRHDPAHCGGCDQPCADGAVCIDGGCGLACGAGASACSDGCFDLDSSHDHCGDCERACAEFEVCADGACAADCPADTLACAGGCVASVRDEANCGGCGVACDAGDSCIAGLCVTADLHHLLISGQSLSTGSGSDVVSSTQPFDNVMFDTGVRAGGAGLTSFVPLVEAFVGGEGETIASGFANALTALTGGAGVGVRTLASAHGVGGQPYTALRKGTVPYANGIAQITAGAAIAQAAGLDSAVRALAIIHGESDHIAGNEHYDQDLLEWQSDVQADVRAITGQPHAVPMFTDQVSSWTAFGSATSSIPLQQLAAARQAPDRIYIVAPKYMLAYLADGVHLPGASERHLGELYAKAWRTVLVDGQPWYPVSPRATTRDGAVITIDFHVPVPPLVLDTETVTDPGNYGFAFTDTSGVAPAISAVELSGPTTVTITLADVPVGGNKRLSYAMFGTPGAPAGPTTGPRGNLRDSDASLGMGGEPLFDWCVHFTETVE